MKKKGDPFLLFFSFEGEKRRGKGSKGRKRRNWVSKKRAREGGKECESGH